MLIFCDFIQVFLYLPQITTLSDLMQFFTDETCQKFYSILLKHYNHYHLTLLVFYENDLIPIKLTKSQIHCYAKTSHKNVETRSLSAHFPLQKL